MARTNASLKKNPQFQALVAVLGSEEKAREAFDRITKPAVDSRVQELMAAGFSEEEAKAALADEAPKPKAEAKPVAKTSKERAEELVADKGYDFTKGRVYGGVTLAEAIARVFRSGKPEIVQSSGIGRTKGVLVYKEESGDVALQNLTKSE